MEVVPKMARRRGSDAGKSGGELDPTVHERRRCKREQDFSSPDYFVTEQFLRQRHQIFHKSFFIFHIQYIIVLLFCLKNLFSIILFLC